MPASGGGGRAVAWWRRQCWTAIRPRRSASDRAEDAGEGASGSVVAGTGKEATTQSARLWVEANAATAATITVAGRRRFLREGERGREKVKTGRRVLAR